MRRATAVTATAVGALVLLATAGIVVARHSGGEPESSAEPCNGAVALCEKRYDQVSFPATHNSMAAADAGWYLPQQPTGIIGQLDAGVRVFLVDSWYGQVTARPGLVVTAASGRQQARRELEQEWSPAVVAAALRARDAVDLEPEGPPEPYLCHAMCELGSIRWETVMAQVRTWLDTHHREVVTFFVQDEVTPADTAEVFEAAGLLPYVHTQDKGTAWPTLEQMIDSGRRVVVLMENHGGGREHPWLMQGFDEVQDTPFDNPTLASMSCDLNRGSAGNPVLLVNAWLSGYLKVAEDAGRVNAQGFLLPYLQRCDRERGQPPTYVAVNFFDRGDLLPVVAALNAH